MALLLMTRAGKFEIKRNHGDFYQSLNLDAVTSGMIHLCRKLTVHYWTKCQIHYADWTPHQMTLLIVAPFASRLTCDLLELFLDLFPVHHLPPIGNVFGSLVVVLEIICVFPNVETKNWQLAN